MNETIRSDGLPFTISDHWPRPSVCLDRLAGELDAATAAAVIGFLRDTTVRNPAHLVLDLAGESAASECVTYRLPLASSTVTPMGDGARGRPGRPR